MVIVCGLKLCPAEESRSPNGRDLQWLSLLTCVVATRHPIAFLIAGVSNYRGLMLSKTWELDTGKEFRGRRWYRDVGLWWVSGMTISQLAHVVFKVVSQRRRGQRSSSVRTERSSQECELVARRDSITANPKPSLSTHHRDEHSQRTFGFFPRLPLELSPSL